MTDDEKYMRLSLEEALCAAQEGEVPVGAVLVHSQSGEVLAKAHNQTELLGDPTAHAEMLALTSATSALGGKYLGDCTLYVSVEPCPMCAGAIAWCQVGRLVYGAPDPKRGYSLYSPSLLHPKTQVTSGVLQQECSRLVSDFFKQRR